MEYLAQEEGSQTEHRAELLTHSDWSFLLELELKSNHYFEVLAVFDPELNCFLPTCLPAKHL